VLARSLLPLQDQHTRFFVLIQQGLSTMDLVSGQNYDQLKLSCLGRGRGERGERGSISDRTSRTLQQGSIALRILYFAFLYHYLKLGCRILWDGCFNHIDNWRMPSGTEFAVQVEDIRYCTIHQKLSLQWVEILGV